MWQQVMKPLAILLCGLGGAALGWLIGYAIYFFTEVLPFRNASDGERLYHAVDGGLAIGILTFMILMPGCAIAGFLISAYLLKSNVKQLEKQKVFQMTS